MATIKDVAARAGVSIATVSNFLNNRGNISEEKHGRIMEAITALNYRPNIIARNLKGQKTRFVAFIVPWFDGIYAHVYRGLASSLEPEGYHILVKTTGDDAYLEEKTLIEVVGLGVSGVIMVPVRPGDSKKYEMLTLTEMPTVFIERHSSDLRFSSVVFDNQAIVYREAASLFEAYGADRVAIVVGPEEYSGERACVEGFMEAYGEHRAAEGRPAPGSEDEYECAHVLRASLDKERAFHSLFDALVVEKREFDAYLVSSAGVAEALKEALLVLGREAAITALDGDVWCTASTARENPRRVGRDAIRLGLESANLLLEYLDKKILFENKKITISPRSVPAGFAVPAVKRDRALKVLLLDCPSSAALAKMSAGYPGGEVQFEILGYLDLHEEVVSRLSSGSSASDVVMVDLPWINSFIENEYLFDFSSLGACDKAFLQELPRSIRDAFLKSGSRFYGLPFVSTIQFLFYRKDLFESEELRWRFAAKYGFDLCPPRNWTEFNIVAEFFNRDASPFSPVERGTAVNGLHPTGVVDEFLPRQWAFNGRMLGPKDRLEVDSPENIRALENLCRTFSLVERECLRFWWDEEFRQLIDGKLAMVVGFASHYPIPAESRSRTEHYYNIAAAPIPGNRPMLGGWMLGINRNSDAAEDAYSFIRWATRDERAIHCMLLGGAMPTNTACTSDFLKLYLPWMRDMRSSFDTAGKREILRDRKGHIVDPYWIDTQMSAKFLDAMLGRATPKDALAQLGVVLSKAQEGRDGLK